MAEEETREGNQFRSLKPVFRGYFFEIYEMKEPMNMDRDFADELADIYIDGLGAIAEALQIKAVTQALIEGASDPGPYYEKWVKEWARRVQVEYSPQTIRIKNMGFDTSFRKLPGPNRTFNTFEDKF